MRTANPAMNDRMYEDLARKMTMGDTAPRTMTVAGTINKTLFLLLLVVGAAAFSWNLAATNPAAATPWMFGGMIGGLIIALITVFKPTVAPYTSPVYALLEGLFLGGISAFIAAQNPQVAIVPQAVALTFGVLFVLLGLYRTGIIRVSDKFRAGIIAATGAIFLVYLSSFILGFFGVTWFGPLHGSGMVGIGFSIIVVIIASLNLVLDFDFIERGAQSDAPKYMEWYGAFALLVSLVWLYIEILRLLSKLNNRR